MLSSPAQRAHAEQTRWPPLDKGLVGRFPTAPAPYESEADIHHVISQLKPYAQLSAIYTAPADFFVNR